MGDPRAVSRWIAGLRAGLRGRDLLRALRSLDPVDGLRADLEGRRVVLFCGNDYLGLSGHPEVRETVAEAVAGAGMGPRAAPLVCGHSADHRRLEEELSRHMATEAALLFPSGYQANTAVLTSLAAPGTAIFSDEKNHASIIDGCRLAARSGARVAVYRHADTGHLEELLAASAEERLVVVTDGVFSMDGDVAPLEALREAKSRHGAFLVVDEAHALLVLGARGAGAAEACGVEDEVDVRVGTLGKALGSQGGFVAARREICEHLVNFARPYIYSTAPSLAVVAAARAALRVFGKEPSRRRTLDGYRELLRDERGRIPPAAIAPVVLGTEAAALKAAEALLARGILVPAIRPPTVPPGTSRLRVTLSAGHTGEEVAGLVRSLADIRPGG